MRDEFIYPLRVHIDDTDYSGLVYHANYLKFMERARSEWAEQEGWGLSWLREQDLTLVVHSLQIDFLKPARLHEHIEVVSQIKSVRRASLVFAQYLRLQAVPSTLLCQAEIKVACVDTALKPHALPQLPMFNMNGERKT